MPLITDVGSRGAGPRLMPGGGRGVPIDGAEDSPGAMFSESSWRESEELLSRSSLSKLLLPHPAPVVTVGAITPFVWGGSMAEMASCGRFFFRKAFCISVSAAISPKSAGATSRQRSAPTLSCGSTRSRPSHKSRSACWTNFSTNGTESQWTKE